MGRSRTPQRRLSGRRTALLAVAVALLAGGVYAANAAQVRRNARAMLDAARAAVTDKPDEARGLYLRYLNFQPKDADALAEYAGLLDRQAAADPRAVRELIDTLDRLLLADPDRAADRRRLADLYLRVGHFTAAREQLDRLLDPARGGTPDDPELLARLATCDQKLGRPADAVERLRAAVATRRAAADAYLRLADLLRADAGSKTAAEDADAVIDQLKADRPADPTARVGRGRYLLAHGRAKDGRAELEAAARESAADPALVGLLADVFLGANEPAAARELLARGIAAAPADPRLRAKLADALARLGDRSAAQTELRGAVAATPDADTFGLDLVDTLIDRGDVATARAEADRRFARRPGFEPAYRYLDGRLKLAAGDWPGAVVALAAARPAFARVPQFEGKLLVAAGDAHRLGNNPDRAAEAYTEAVRRLPGAADPAVKLAGVQAQLGRRAEAAELAGRFADAAPAARALAVRLAFEAQLARPAPQRDWAAVERAAGKPPYPAEVELVRAAALDARGKGGEAGDVLAAAVAAHPADVPLRLAVASLAGRADPKAGLAAIDVAAKAVGDRAAFRLARAGYLTRVGADRAAVEAVADGAEALPPAERFALFVGLGELLAAGRNEPAAAVPWLRKAIAADRFDVRSRGLLAEVLVGLGRDAEADAAVADLAALEGADGPHVLYARAARLVADRAKAAEARALLEAVAAKRESWGRPHLLLARLAEADGQPDAAIDRYQRAYALGERGDAVVRPLANLLVARGRYAEAVALLEGRERDGRLAADERQQLAAAEALAGRRTERTAAAVKAAETSNDPKDHLFRGRLLLLDGKPADAAAAFERAVALGPTLTEAWVERVYALRLAGRADAAKAAAARAEAALKGPAALVPLGRIRALIDDPAGAERLYLDALRQSPADPEPRVQLAVLLRAAGRADEADARLRELLATAAPDATKRWARRTLAESLAARPDGYRRLSEAVALVDENLTAANAPEDRRAKGLLLSIDPFRRAEARDLIRSAAGSPATPDESARVGLLMEQEGDLAAAEDAFREAVRGPLPQPGHLEMLHRVLVARKRPAGDVLARLKAVEPAGWPAAVAEARQLAADGKPGDAADRLLAFPAAKDAAFRAGRVAPLLADLGCPAEAERVLRESGQRVPLASFLARAGRWREAVELVNSLAPAECPPRARAGLLRAAFGVSRRAVVKPSDHPAWDRAADEAERWLAAQAAAAPADPVFPASLGVLADARGRADEAIRAYETALALSPDLPDARNNLAALLLARGDAPDRPLELMNRAIELAGPQPHLLDTRATVRLAAGKPHDAIRDLEAAVAVSRKPVYLFHLAQAHEKAGNGGLKLEYVERAVRAGLRRPHLHPAEWEEYDRLVGG